MKPFFKSYPGQTTFLLSFLIMFFVSACGGGNQQKAQNEKLNDVKETTRLQLQQLEKDIEERIDYVDEQIEEASGELEQNLREVRDELKTQQEVVEKEMENVKNATIETWDNVLNNVKTNYQDARTKMNEASKKVREWLED
jgi:peptidoglycan hydrolase CwlO-like protein